MSEHVIGLLWAGLVIAARRRPFPAVRHRLSATQVDAPTGGRADPFGVLGAAVLRMARVLWARSPSGASTRPASLAVSPARLGTRTCPGSRAPCSAGEREGRPTR